MNKVPPFCQIYRQAWSDREVGVIRGAGLLMASSGLAASLGLFNEIVGVVLKRDEDPRLVQVGRNGIPDSRVGYFRYFLIFSVMKNDFLHFFSS